MVYLLIPADYHVRQGRKRDTARGDEADTGNAYARSADGGQQVRGRCRDPGQGLLCWALDKAYRVLDNCG